MDFHTISRKELKQLQTSARRTRFHPTSPKVTIVLQREEAREVGIARAQQEEGHGKQGGRYLFSAVQQWQGFCRLSRRVFINWLKDWMEF
ncbi:hypothetical protein E2542_SST01675 [Spatholobus suberectus]|nr:hypothetical protein E2542_SST01675 [Spatholobus suberectus]